MLVKHYGMNIQIRFHLSLSKCVNKFGSKGVYTDIACRLKMHEWKDRKKIGKTGVDN